MRDGRLKTTAVKFKTCEKEKSVGLLFAFAGKAGLSRGTVRYSAAVLTFPLAAERTLYCN